MNPLPGPVLLLGAMISTSLGVFLLGEAYRQMNPLPPPPTPIPNFSSNQPHIVQALGPMGVEVVNA